MLSTPGSDGVVFFNMNAINRHLANPKAGNLIEDIFGQKAEQLRHAVTGKRGEARQGLILNGYSECLQEAGAKFILPLRFDMEHSKRTSHHLFFVTKSSKGFELMKSVMAPRVSSTEDGIPLYRVSSH
ncbi:MAG TPA: hypothetical protein VEI97_02130, partial [bacterium]|nr:hypothetical protein [bacterium]